MPKELRFNHDRRRRPFWRDERLLGKTYIDRQAEALLVIGKDSWSRQEFVDDLHCGHPNAARNLSKLAAKLEVDSLDQLIARFTLEDLLKEYGVGPTTVIVLMQAQEAKHKDPEKWLDRKPDDIVTLDTEKRRVMKRPAPPPAKTKQSRSSRSESLAASA